LAGIGRRRALRVERQGVRTFNELLQSPRGLKALVAAGSFIAIVVVALVAAPAVVRGKVEREARERGFEAEIAGVRWGWGKVWLRGVRVTAPGEDFELRLDAVSVGWFSRDVAAEGGALRGAGDPRKLLDKVRGKASAPSAGNGDAGDAGGRAFSVAGLYVRWQRDKDSVEAFGAHAARRGQELELGADLARASDAQRAVEARGLVLAAQTKDGRKQLVRLGTKALEVTWHAEPAAVKAPAPVRPAKAEVKNDAGESDAVLARAGKLRALRAALLPLLKEQLADGASLALDGVSARVDGGSERLSFGPSRLLLGREGETLHVSLSPSATEAGVTPLALNATLPLGPGALHVVAKGGPVSLASLGVRAGQLGLRDVEQATLAADGSADFSEDFETVELDGKLQVHGLSLQRPELSPAPVGPWSFDAALRARARLDGTALTVLSSEAHLGEVRAELVGQIETTADRRHVEGRLRVPLSGCQSVLDAVPNGLLPLVNGVKLSGSFGIDLQVRYDQAKPEDTRVALSVKNECRIREAPPSLSPHRFERPFLREVKGPDGTPMTLEGGPGTPSWVSIDDISRHMESAILICEDAGFHSHAGFDFHALENAIKDDLKQGRFARGASTVSMQLAKNLYLSQEKTLGRKLQEALLTMLLEQELDKRRILELYLNVVELGPGLYGVRDAAEYYFATPARSLTLGQSLYLASLLPNPTYSRFGPDGKLNQGWLSYLHKLMHIAHKIKRIDDAELEAGLAEQIAFRVPGVPAPTLPEGDSGDAPAPPELSEPGGP